MKSTGQEKELRAALLANASANDASLLAKMERVITLSLILGGLIWFVFWMVAPSSSRLDTTQDTAQISGPTSGATETPSSERLSTSAPNNQQVRRFSDQSCSELQKRAFEMALDHQHRRLESGHRYTQIEDTDEMRQVTVSLHAGVRDRPQYTDARQKQTAANGFATGVAYLCPTLVSR